MSDSRNEDQIEFLYDSECPICTRFARSLQDSQNIKAIDARTPSDLLEASRQMNLDIDTGTLLRCKGKIYYGWEAYRHISLQSHNKGLFMNVNRWLVKNRTLAKFAYHVFVAVRRILLRLRGKALINESRTDRGKSFEK